MPDVWRLLVDFVKDYFSIGSFVIFHSFLFHQFNCRHVCSLCDEPPESFLSERVHAGQPSLPLPLLRIWPINYPAENTLP